MSLKTAIRAFRRNLFGSTVEVMDVGILFHKDANPFGAHGYLRASSIEHGLQDTEIRFVFPGLSTPPVLTPRLMYFIWEEAQNAGFIPLSLTTYGLVLPTDKVPARSMVSALRNQADSTNLARRIGDGAARQDGRATPAATQVPAVTPK